MFVDIFSRKMTLLKRVSLRAEEQNGDNIQTITIGEFCSPEWQRRNIKNIDTIRALCPNQEAKEKNKQEVTRFKLQELAGMVSCVSAGLSESDIIELNGVICLDIDESHNRSITYWEGFKWAFSCLPFVAYCGLSITGRGVWALVPISDKQDFEAHYNALKEELKTTSLKMFTEDNVIQEIDGIVIDEAPTNPASKRFISYDPEPYICPTALEYINKLFTKKEQKEVAVRVEDTVPVIPIFWGRYANMCPYVKSRRNGHKSSFDIEGFFAKYNIEYSLSRPRQGGLQYVVRCPWESLHTTGESNATTAVFLYPDGKPGFNCKHDHCRGKGWKEYKQFYEGPPKRVWNLLKILHES